MQKFCMRFGVHRIGMALVVHRDWPENIEADKTVVEEMFVHRNSLSLSTLQTSKIIQSNFVKNMNYNSSNIVQLQNERSTAVVHQKIYGFASKPLMSDIYEMYHTFYVDCNNSSTIKDNSATFCQQHQL